MDVEFLRMYMANCDEMQTIFSSDLATDKYSMG
jgi:hypothetical protein